MHKLKEKNAIESIKCIKKDKRTITLKSELEAQNVTKQKISKKLINIRPKSVNNNPNLK